MKTIWQQLVSEPLTEHFIFKEGFKVASPTRDSSVHDSPSPTAAVARPQGVSKSLLLGGLQADPEGSVTATKTCLEFLGVFYYRFEITRQSTQSAKSHYPVKNTVFRI